MFSLVCVCVSQRRIPVIGPHQEFLPIRYPRLSSLRLKGVKYLLCLLLLYSMALNPTPITPIC